MAAEYVSLEGSLVLPARVEGAADVFQCPQFTLVKPNWVPDEQSNYCELCNTKFSQIKRRHHCRMCGAIRCAKCCNEKIPLPQLGLEEAERVCESCKTVTEMVTKARSPQDSFLIESSKGLATFARHEKHIKKLVELGGTQTLIVLASTENPTVLGYVATGLHCLATHPSLHKHLADSGAIKAICRVLTTVGDSNEQIAVDGISALMIFCRSPDLKTKALNDGVLQPVLNLCWSERDAISLVAISTLGLIAENPAAHNAIFNNRQNAVARLLQLSNASDEQMQEVALKTLAFLSTGSVEYKHRLVQEDFSSGRCLRTAFESNPHNPQILCNVACLIANLASNEQDQAGLHDVLQSACRKLGQAESNTELLCHLTRALANFAKHRQNASILVNAIPDVVKCCLKSGTAPVQMQSMRLLLTLLGNAPAQVSSLLMREGAQSFLTNLGEIPSFLDTVQTSLASEAPAIAKPL